MVRFVVALIVFAASTALLAAASLSAFDSGARYEKAAAKKV
jgi:hypothetical protein